jgi:protein SCO1
VRYPICVLGQPYSTKILEITQVRTVGKAAIGGPFELLDKDGAVFTEKDLLSRWTLIYFGFTMCPDVCPDELTKVAEVLDTLARHGKTIGPTAEADISPILISIDPERDTPKRTHEYAVGFHKAFTGLSGSLDQARVAAKAYRVYFSKDDNAGDDYLVDHSIITYLMDPKGEFVDFYAKNVTAPEMAASMEAKMLAWRP